MKYHSTAFLIFILSFFSSTFLYSEGEHFQVAAPQGVPSSLKIYAYPYAGSWKPISDVSGDFQIKGVFRHIKENTEEGTTTKVDSQPFTITFSEGIATIADAEIRDQEVSLSQEAGKTVPVHVVSFSPWWSLLPPLLAIILALITKEVLLSLLVGTASGIFVLSSFQPIATFHSIFDYYLIGVMSNGDNVHVIIFSLLIGGMVGIIASSGGLVDLVNRLSRWARTPRSGMISTWCMGVIIFFDDYANTLLVGNSMRPITDKLKISREKLAFIVDSTAAPVASLAFISTWIGYELGFISSFLEAQDPTQKNQAFGYFIASIPYHFYSILMLVFVFTIAASKKDYGPMWHAEKRARTTGQVLGEDAVPLSDNDMNTLEPPKGKPCRWYNALVPIFVVIVATIVGLYVNGAQALGTYDAPLLDIVKEANSFTVLIWAAVWGCLSAGLLVLIQSILTLQQTLEAWVRGIKSMILAVMVLVLAWTLKTVCDEMQTNVFIFHMTKDMLSVSLIPVLSFLISAVVAFATGTSWGTMGLIFPFVLGLSTEMSAAQLNLGIDTGNYILMGTIGSVLAGASLGDHCSPISDTTVMSSMATSCDHIDHVKTQMPYALTVGGVGALFGYLPAGFGVSPWISLIIGVAALVGIVHFLGREIPENQESADSV